MKRYIRFFVCLILYFGLCTAIFNCPNNLETQSGFKSTKFSGVYFHLSRIPTTLYANKHCIFTIFQELDGKIYEMTDVYKNSQKQDKQDVAEIDMLDGGNVGYMKAIYPSGTVVNMHVAIVNNDTVALILACTSSFFSIERRAWILSRKPVATSQQLEPIYQRLEKSGFKRTDLVTSFDPILCTDLISTNLTFVKNYTNEAFKF